MKPLDPHSVYRCFDAAGRLLYVGMTACVLRRMQEHRVKDWWPRVASITVKHYPNRRTARNAERLAIVRERPEINADPEAAAARAARRAA